MKNTDELVHDLGLSSNSVESVIIAAYRRWGEDYPAYLRGAVATVIFDRSNDTLIASRDKMGERRIFYARKGRGAAVSDHPDALLGTQFAAPVIDINGVNELFALGPARAPSFTPYRDIMALDAGCTLIANRGGIRIKRHFRLEAAPHEDSPEETVEKTRNLLDNIIEETMPRSNACMLSGGLDSTALTALFAARGAKPRTFSVDYENDAREFSANAFQPERDRDYVKLAADLFSGEHHDIVLNHDSLVNALSDAVNARGFPGMADIDSSLLLFARGIAKHATSVVTGECADEVFCGYPWFGDDFAQGDSFPWSGSMDLRNVLLRDDVREAAKPEKYAIETFKSEMENAPNLTGESAENARIRAMQYVCFRYFMRNLQERALTMCESANIDVIAPFADERLAQYVWNVPREIKFMNGEVKGLLRAAVGDLLPDKLLHRKKSPYPKTYSTEYTRAVRGMINDILAVPNSPVFDIVERRVLRQLNEAELPANGLPWFGQLMSGPQMLAYIIQVNEWMKLRRISIKI